MMRIRGAKTIWLPMSMAVMLMATKAKAADEVKIDTGVVSGITVETPGVRVFRGIPFAAPPVGDFRWKAPQPAAKWEGVRKGEEFGPRCVRRLRSIRT